MTLLELANQSGKSVDDLIKSDSSRLSVFEKKQKKQRKYCCKNFRAFWAEDDVVTQQ